MRNRRVLMVHYRVGKTDGVSIEMASWKKILEHIGTEVRYCAGSESIGAHYVIDDLEQQLNDRVFHIDQDAFGGIGHFEDETSFQKAFNDCATDVANQFRDVIDDFKPTDILISNMFCVGEGLPAAKGILTILDEKKINTIIINHDFYWEESRYEEPSTEFVSEFISKNLPPDRTYIQHCTINSIGQKALKNIRGIDSMLFHDTFDYGNCEWTRTPQTTAFLEDNGINKDTFVFLQATRIVRRKNIELSIDFVKEFLTQYAKQKELHDYKRVVLLLAGYVERRDEYYLRQLINYAEKQKVDLLYIGDKLHKEYELFDIYPYANVITFPSQYEGFGNQLLEAFNAQKPIVLFEYPVYQADIKPLGFDAISLGDTIFKTCPTNGLKSIKPEENAAAVRQLIDKLADPEKINDMVAQNYKIAEEHFGYHVTEKKFRTLLENFEK